jgi:hypothetical protein
LAQVNAIAKSALAAFVAIMFCGAADPPSATRTVPLDYPRLALIAMIQGRVELQARISEDGAVMSISAKSGHPLLLPAAKESLLQWRFTPCSGDLGTCTVAIKFVFVIKGQCPDKCKTEFIVNRPDQVTVRAKKLPPMID